MQANRITNSVYRNLLWNILDNGKEVNCRGFETLEIVNSCTAISMKNPMVSLPARKLGYRFAAAEAHWILSGDYRVESIRKYSPIIHKFSDDGLFYFGAYGPKIVQQLPYIISAFKRDIHTRQAVISIWRESPPISKDVPCSLTAQFLIRENTLDCILSMRSSDAWLGVPYDWFNFSMLSAYLSLILRDILGVKLELGLLHLNAGSQHLYKKGFGYTLDDAYRVAGLDQEEFMFTPLDVNEFINSEALLIHLARLKDRKRRNPLHNFLKELEGEPC